MLKKMGPQPRIFNEMKMIADTSFKFSTEETAVDMVEEVCESMQYYPPEDYITGPALYYEYDPKVRSKLHYHICFTNPWFEGYWNGNGTSRSREG